MAMRAGPSPAGLLHEQSRPARTVRSITAFGARHRRLLAALCAGAAVLVAVSAMTPASPAAPAASNGQRSPGRGGGLPAAAGSLPADTAERVAVAVRLADPAGLLLLRVGGHAEVIAGPRSDPALPVAAGGPVGSEAVASDSEVLAADAVVLAVPGVATTSLTGDTRSEGGDGGLLGELGGSGAGYASAGTPSGLDGVVLVAVPPSDARRLAAAAGTRALSVAVGLPSAR
jgi:hypothetical protein